MQMAPSALPVTLQESPSVPVLLPPAWPCPWAGRKVEPLASSVFVSGPVVNVSLENSDFFNKRHAEHPFPRNAPSPAFCP